jgi:hypothetical protein
VILGEAEVENLERQRLGLRQLETGAQTIIQIRLEFFGDAGRRTGTVTLPELRIDLRHSRESGAAAIQGRGNELMQEQIKGRAHESASASRARSASSL